MDSPNRDLDNGSTPDPRLPLELEREIFIYAILSDIQDPTNLFLVAKRVREWLFPIAFKIVIVCPRRFFPVPFLELSSYQQYGSYVQFLLLSDVNSVSDNFKPLMPIFNECLAQCPNITDLGLWCNDPPVTLESLINLSALSRLSMDAHHLHKLFQSLDPIPETEREATGIALFPRITQLNMLRTLWMPSPDCELFVGALGYHFPRITHFAHSHYLWNLENTGLLELVLRKFKKLKVFVLWKQAYNELAVDREFVLSVKDERIVTMLTIWEKDWEREVRGTGMGMWMLADRILEERRSKQVINLAEILPLS
ncbi:hypothetical protein BDN72DRAFT_860418 [Pluteus cervinus]|uniref:Uncharacterized protein n=1 Tax=Pluteus cervinus TaxID=181527 RepID=A0ACD3AK70_9AGAR|nr:hypothetical protein BDN72DRAFT_860418 [Pluteus cervinus]